MINVARHTCYVATVTTNSRLLWTFSHIYGHFESKRDELKFEAGFTMVNWQERDQVISSIFGLKCCELSTNFMILCELYLVQKETQ